ncbi:MAG: carbohydrate binding family 9 domain-containing protein [Gemmatimonadota bacterium]|nr:MAG: carbohydrate binding family 9 domain-containing protein [Gemmatimonadota bacterium]
MEILTRACVLSLLPALLPGPAHAQETSANDYPPPEIRAAQREGPIRIDGRLDEPDWQAAEPASDLIQLRPDEGSTATQVTQVRFLFDDDALYIGARMYDELGASGVRTRMARRDGDTDSDELTITFDTFHDHLGQTIFSVNPSKVKFDAYGPGGSNPDPSWDPIWEVETEIDSLGWTAEFRISFSQLRYPRDSPQTWGLQIVRVVNRLNEHSQWAFWRLNETGGPSRYGHLTDLTIPPARRHLELLPYIVGRSSNIEPSDPDDPFQDPHELDSRFGLDLRYLLTSNLTLTATINPDFGQVEVDPAVVNLSAFETFFEEKRPFFVEGRGLLSFGGLSCFFCSNVSSLNLFYSRRIGRVPQGGGIAEDAGDFADVPENTAILGAAKVTGRTAGGWSVGALDAMARREHATVLDSDSTFRQIEVEPLTNYFVGRLARDLRGGDLVLAGMFTSVIRDLHDPALSERLNRHAENLGLESSLWWADRTYRLRTSFAVSQIAADSSAILRAQKSSARYLQRPDRQHGNNGIFTDAFDPSLTSMRGFAGYGRLSKESGDWLWELSTNIRSPGFEANDVAFLTNADYLWMNGNILRQYTTPGSFYRSMLYITGGQQQYNFDGDLTDRQVQIFGDIEFHNYWEIATFWIHRFTVFDDRLTRGGPVVKRPGFNYWLLEAATDSRRNLVFGLSPAYGCNFEGACDFELNLGLIYRPMDNIAISLSPSFYHSESTAQYVTSVEDPTASAFYGNRYVFADLDQNTLSMEARLNITFTPTLTLEVFAQPLISSGRYTNFKEFAAPRSIEKKIYGKDMGKISKNEGTYTVDPDTDGPAQPFSFDDPDFNFRSLRGNAVLRWEFRPGSTLFLVWTQERADQAAVGDFNFSRDFDALFSAHADNIFLLKVNYWLQL